MKVLIACEFSGIVRDAFIKRGHDAVSCDLLPTERPGPHIQDDALRVIWGTRDKYRQHWDLLIAHPPCTYLCNSGVRWLYGKNKAINQPRWDRMRKAAIFFDYIQSSSIRHIAIENPTPHKYAVEIIGRKYDQIIQPWQFGHGETKATCLWLKGLQRLKPTNVVDGREGKMHKMSPGKDRGKLRSVTFQGIADAMAEQWG